MSAVPPQPLPTSGRLLKATLLAIVVAGVVLVAFVLPAEYGIDPAGLGRMSGVDVLAPAQASRAAPAAVSPAAAPAPGAAAPVADEANALEAKKSAEAFGPTEGQGFDVKAVSRAPARQASESMTVTIAPRGGIEIKAPLDAGESMVFHWKASGDVAVDMHGERHNAPKDTYTSYWVEAAQREGAGTLTAPFDGIHGWFWMNRGNDPVTLTVDVAGFQDKLFVPGH